MPSPPIRFSIISRGGALTPIYCPEFAHATFPSWPIRPVEQGRILRDRTLARVAARHGATPVQVALAWLLTHKDLMVIPKTSNAAHVRDLPLTEADLPELGKAFPPPRGARPLEML
jgi:diketogulonate reductase-like aldo/keto reductase